MTEAMPGFLIVDPTNYLQLMKELSMNGSGTALADTVIGLTIVVLPIPETFYVAGSPGIELLRYAVERPLP